MTLALERVDVGAGLQILAPLPGHLGDVAERLSELAPVDLPVPEAMLTALQVMRQAGHVCRARPGFELARALPERGHVLGLPLLRTEDETLPVLEKILGFADEREPVTGWRTSGLVCVDQLRHGTFLVSTPRVLGTLSKAALPTRGGRAAAQRRWYSTIANWPRSAPWFDLMPDGPRNHPEKHEQAMRPLVAGTKSREITDEILSAAGHVGAMVYTGWSSQRTA